MTTKNSAENAPITTKSMATIIGLAVSVVGLFSLAHAKVTVPAILRETSVQVREEVADRLEVHKEIMSIRLEEHEEHPHEGAAQAKELDALRKMLTDAFSNLATREMQNEIHKKQLRLEDRMLELEKGSG